jgi:hypothetical protein
MSFYRRSHHSCHSVNDLLSNHPSTVLHLSRIPPTLLVIIPFLVSSQGDMDEFSHMDGASPQDIDSAIALAAAQARTLVNQMNGNARF